MSNLYDALYHCQAELRRQLPIDLACVEVGFGQVYLRFQFYYKRGETAHTWAHKIEQSTLQAYNDPEQALREIFARFREHYLR